MVLSCGTAYAVPQDWPCKEFELQKCEQTEKSIDHIAYCRKDNNYTLKVNVFWREDMKSDDCGTAGCDGTITNLKTGQEENLRFFCEQENDSGGIKCHIRSDEEYILQKVTDDYYQVSLCDNTFLKYVNLKECSECTCVVHDSRTKDRSFDYYMRCKKSDYYLHCMTGNVYEEKYKQASGFDDLKNCQFNIK